MKLNKYAWFSILFSLIILGLLGFLLLNGTFFKGTAANPAQPYEMTLFLIFLAALGVWCLSGGIGWILLSRRGFFADLLEKLVGYEYVGCIVGILLLAGLWVVAVLPGPFLMWFASTRRPHPICPQCKRWLPHGATRCAHCGTELTGTQAGSLVTPVPVESAIESTGENRCEKCHADDPVGEIYSFAYGTFAESEYLGNQTTRYSFKIAGTKEVYLCDQCVTEFGKKRVQRYGLGVSFGLLAFMIALYACSLVFNLVSEGAIETDSMRSGVVFMLILAPVLYLIITRRADKQPLAQGDLLALQLYKPALKSQGYTRFYTRQQLRDNQLL